MQSATAVLCRAAEVAINAAAALNAAANASAFNQAYTLNVDVFSYACQRDKNLGGPITHSKNTDEPDGLTYRNEDTGRREYVCPERRIASCDHWCISKGRQASDRLRTGWCCNGGYTYSKGDNLFMSVIQRARLVQGVLTPCSRITAYIPALTSGTAVDQPCAGCCMIGTYRNNNTSDLSDPLRDSGPSPC